MENLFFFFFSYYWLQQNFCSGHSHRLGTFAATLQVRCEAVFVWATHGVCATSVHSWDWLGAGAVCGSVATRAVPQDKTAAKVLTAR